MVLNIVFLVGGAFVGYLLRGEIQRRKSTKQINGIVNAALEIATKIAESSNKEEESKDDFEDIWDSAKSDIAKIVDIGNSNDETIKL